MWIYTDKPWKDYQGRCACGCSEHSSDDDRQGEWKDIIDVNENMV